MGVVDFRGDGDPDTSGPVAVQCQYRGERFPCDPRFGALINGRSDENTHRGKSGRAANQRLQ